MNRIKNQLIFAFIALVFYQSSSLLGYWYELTAPKMDAKDLAQAPVPLEQQRKDLIEFEYQVCRAITPCAAATMTSNLNVIESACESAISQLQNLDVPTGLPISVVKNMKIYRQALINGEMKTLHQWQTTKKARGARGQSFAINWEIDTCGYTSIPQKIRRLYGLDELSHTKIITCKEIDALKAQLLPPRNTASEKQ